MLPMKKLGIILSILALFGLSTTNANGQRTDTVDYLVKMNLKAMGGKRNLENVKTIVRIRGSANMITVTRLKPTYGSLIIWWIRLPGKYGFQKERMTIILGNRLVTIPDAR